jgi:CheY-like chemotaxis protein
LLGRVVANLLSNAVKYTDKGGILVGAVAFRDRVRIDVVDTGIGIPAAYHNDVFKEFFQIDNRGRDRRRGLGLGLFIVRRSLDLLPAHRLQLVSRERKGSRFSVSVPRSASPAPAQLAMPTPHLPDRLRGAYVAVVDDEPAVLEGLVVLLNNWGCLVAGGLSGAQLADALSENERLPDLVIADLRLGGGETGLEAVRLLHSRLSIRAPVLIMTGDPVASVSLEDLDVQLRLMHKPVIAAALREALEQMLPARQLVREA